MIFSVGTFLGFFQSVLYQYFPTIVFFCTCPFWQVDMGIHLPNLNLSSPGRRAMLNVEPWSKYESVVISGSYIGSY